MAIKHVMTKHGYYDRQLDVLSVHEDPAWFIHHPNLKYFYTQLTFYPVAGFTVIQWKGGKDPYKFYDPLREWHGQVEFGHVLPG